MAELAAAFELARADLVVRVELTCSPGVTCLMGPSGAGKTTILGALAGLVTPDRGRIALGGSVWFDRAPDARAAAIDVPVHRRPIAYVFQGLALFPHMTALGNVMYAMGDAPRVDRPAKAQGLLNRLGVGHLADRRPRTFSGGEAQRVALARSLARAPGLMLFDEPFSALDRELRTQLVSLVREVVAELGVPAVHVTHSDDEARQIADRVVRIARGSIVAVGAPAEVLGHGR